LTVNGEGDSIAEKAHEGHGHGPIWETPAETGVVDFYSREQNRKGPTLVVTAE
jgi:hypothetical protein